MAFDPDAFINEDTKPPRGFDPDEFLRMNAPKPEPTSAIKAAGIGLMQGASGRMSDELGAATDAALGRVPYPQALAQQRAAVESARREHPWITGGAELAGSFLPTALIGRGLQAVGAATRLGEVGTQAAQGLIEGGATAFGGSNATTLQGRVEEGTKGAAAGGLLGGLIGKAFQKYVGNAPERHVGHVVEDLTTGTTPTQRKKFAPVRELAGEFFDRTPENKKLLSTIKSDPAGGSDIVADRIHAEAIKTRPLYEVIDKAAPPITAGQTLEKIESALAAAEKTHGEATMARALRGMRDQFLETEMARAGAKGKMSPEEFRASSIMMDAPVSSYDVRHWVTANKLFFEQTLGGLSENERSQLREKLWEVSDDILKDHLKAAASSSDVARNAVQVLRPINKDITVLSKVEDVLKPKVQAQLTEKSGDLKKFKDAARDWGAGGTLGTAAYLSGMGVIPATAVGVATKATQVGLEAAHRKATELLADNLRKAASGDQARQAVADALEKGVPRYLVASLLSAWQSEKNLVEANKTFARSR